jgi:hypothetical protein
MSIGKNSLASKKAFVVSSSSSSSEPVEPVETTSDHIRGYIDAGIYSLIPLKHGTKNKPLVDWKPYQKRLPTPSEITSWFSRPSLCNVAAVLGQASRLVAIDIDGDAAKQRVEKKLAFIEVVICSYQIEALSITLDFLRASSERREGGEK